MPEVQYPEGKDPTDSVYAETRETSSPRMSPYLNNHTTIVPLQMKCNLRSKFTLGNDLLLEKLLLRACLDSAASSVDKR